LGKNREIERDVFVEKRRWQEDLGICKRKWGHCRLRKNIEVERDILPRRKKRPKQKDLGNLYTRG